MNSTQIWDPILIPTYFYYLSSC